MCPGSCLLCSDVTFGSVNLEEILSTIKNGNELEVMIEHVPEQPVPQQQATANPVQSGQISTEAWYAHTGSPQSVLTEALRSTVQEESKESTSRDPLECTMCSDIMTSRKHTHYSTTELESVFIPATETRRVVLDGDTMYGIWDNLPANTEHFEMDSIVGGTVKDMTRALRKNYLQLSNRVEIMVIAGINNIGAGETAEEILNDMKVLKQVVADHSRNWGHSPPSYVVFCTVILPPKFCSLYVPPNPPQPEIAMWLPPHNFTNKYDELKKLNEMILEVNMAEELKCVRMDFHGVKRLNSGRIQHKFDTRPNAEQIWSEPEVFSKLHFTMDKKVKLAGHITECFKHNHNNQQQLQLQ